MRREIRPGDLVFLDVKTQDGVTHPLYGVQFAFAVDYKRGEIIIANPLNVEGCAKIAFDISDASAIHPLSVKAIASFGLEWCENFRETWKE